LRRILLLAKIPIKRAFRFSSQQFLVPETLIGHDFAVSHWNTQISLQEAFMAIKDLLQNDLLVNPASLAEYGADILAQVHQELRQKASSINLYLLAEDLSK
jgi:hypothetical protein